ncbi:hypothetical protein GOBAR_DD28977 [Gossypium barbadense]|nr:hypothetical protein GOBAR_DD28977 [Gossypium barbadense]
MRNNLTKENKEQATATSNCAAASAVKVSLSFCLTVGVGCTPYRARHGVPLQSPIAYVPRGLLYTPVNIRVHVKLIVLHALGH